jgi:hypothetical protein
MLKRIITMRQIMGYGLDRRPAAVYKPCSIQVFGLESSGNLAVSTPISALIDTVD